MTGINLEPENLSTVHSILAVDDDAKILGITEMILQKEGYQVSVAQSGEEALAALDNKRIDLVLLDVMLPDADGYMLCKTIKTNEQTQGIPVIMLTALDGVDNKVRGLDVGACDYLVKPFLQRELLARIRTHLREREFAREMKSLYSSEKKRSHELEILNKLTNEFNESIDLEKLLSHAARTISTELRFHACVIALHDSESNEFKIRASYHPVLRAGSQGHSLSSRDGTMGWVLATQNPVLVPNAATEPRFVGYFPDSRSQMGVPLTHKNKVVGVLNVESNRPHGYSPEDLNLLSTVAGNLALALRNAQLYAEAKLSSQNLRSIVDERTRELVNQRKFMECIIDSLPIGIYVIDSNYSVVTWNRKRETGILGISRDQVIGHNILSVFSKMAEEKLRSEFDQVLQTGVPFETETVSWSSGEKRYFHLRKIPMSINGDCVTHVITLGEDITDRRRMEESLFTNEKLASIGKLSAGIAHEINNPLAAIAGCVEGLISRAETPELARVPAFEDFPEYLKIIDDEITRCKGIINNLLDFSRTKEIKKQEISINETLEQTLQLLSHHKAFRQITVIRELDPDCPPVTGNSGELRQVFLAMAINAMDAMDAVNGSGTLTIRTCTELRKGLRFVCVQFQDTGVGISRQNINRIFDPFFTTKSVGKGTGLGLSICYGIVRSHNGFIRVASEEGKGSLFEVFIPATASNKRHV